MADAALARGSDDGPEGCISGLALLGVRLAAPAGKSS